MELLNVAIIGQGRSGKDIHGAYMRSARNERFRVRYVVERDARRRAISEQIYPGCEALTDYRELFEKKDVDLVVNASFSDEHYPISLDLLRHGFNVLSEKPMARNQFECDTLVHAAREQGVLYAVFQNTMFAPYVLHALSEAKSGKFGEILEVKVRYNSLARRWDWQTLQKKMGGNAYNTGPHPLGIAAGFLGFSRETAVAYAKLGRTELTSGDADDFCKVVLTAPGKPMVDVEMHSSDPFTDYTLAFIGTRGSYRSTARAYRAKYLTPEENAPQPLQEHFLEDADGNPLYCGEKAVFHEESGEFTGSAFDIGADTIYREVYANLTEGKPLTYTAEDYSVIYRVEEVIHAQNPLPRLY